MFRKTCALALSTLMLLSVFSTGNLTRAMGKSREEENTIVASEEEEQDVPFYGKKTVDGILVSVKADAGVFPKKAKLKVKKLSQKVDKKKVEEKVEEKLKEEDAELLESFIFDISVLDAEGEELQPDNEKGDVKVSFERLNILAKGKELAVFHLDEPDAEPEKLSDVKVKEKEKKLEVKTDHFSLFVLSVIDRSEDDMETGSLGMEEGEDKNLNEFLSKGDRFVEGIEVSSNHEDIVRVHIDPDTKDVHIKALKEGKATLTIKNKVIVSGSEVEQVKQYTVIVQGPFSGGRLGQNMKYSLSGEGKNMTLTISGYGYGDDRERAPWFAYRDKIKKVIIAEGVEGLGIRRAPFGYMENLEDVTLPSTLKEISDFAFIQSNKLKNLIIPASVVEIGSQAFYKEGTDATHNTIINRSSIYLEDTGKLHYNHSFTTVKQTAKKKEEQKKRGVQINSIRLYQVPSIQKSFLEVNISGASSKSIAECYFFRTQDANKTVKESDFSTAYKDSMNLAGWRTGEDNWKASYYTDVSNINWLDNKTYYCYILLVERAGGDPPKKVGIFKQTIKVGTDNRLPDTDGKLNWSVEKSGTASSGQIKYKLTIGGNGAIKDYNAVNGYREWDKLFFALGEEPKSIKLVLQDGISKIGSYAFNGISYGSATKLEGDLKIPDTVKEIGVGAFSNLNIKGKIIFPSHLKKIDAYAFSDVLHDGDLILPNGLEEIEEEAFSGNHIGNIRIPASVKKIGLHAFFKEEMGRDGINTIVNHSAVKLSERYANPLFTKFDLDDSEEGSTVWTGKKGGSGGNSYRNYWRDNVPNTVDSSAKKVKWKKDSKGWWIQNEDGSYPKNEWKLINKSWYFFNKEGYMSTGWIFQNNTWYYLEGGENENSGKMSTGWKLLNGTWYYLSKEEGANNGKMLTGWQRINGRWYYLSTEEGINNGKMLTGWRLINGKWYYFSTEAGINNGKMLLNTVVDGYTLKEDGSWDTQKKKAG